MTVEFELPMARSKSLKVEYLDLENLTPYAANARLHPQRQLTLLQANMRVFGFLVPVLIDGRNGLIAGHARIEAAKRMGLKEVPCIRVEHLTEAQKRAYIIADNRLAELATWDRATLSSEFRFLAEVDVDFDLEITGFVAAETDLLIIDENEVHRPDPVDVVPAMDLERPAVSRQGDLWRLGKHRLLCGDALESASFNRLLGEERAQLIFTDPPFNCRIAHNVSGLGKIKHSDFRMASGEMSSGEFTEFLKTSFAHLAAFSVDGAIHFIFIDWRRSKEMIAAGEAVYSELKNLCVWAKTNGGMGSLYRSRHELVFVWKSGTAPHINNIELGRYGRYRTNVWEYAGANSFGSNRDAELAMHPTVKPVALIADAIRDCSKRGGIVLDPFAGSGSTIIAAERTGRRAAAIEIDERYVDTAIRRFQDLTGKPALHAETGLSFAETRRQREQELLDSATATPTSETEIRS
jgi:DNA modification methylase